jgi:hypothetical protein
MQAHIGELNSNKCRRGLGLSGIRRTARNCFKNTYKIYELINNEVNVNYV